MSFLWTEASILSVIFPMKGHFRAQETLACGLFPTFNPFGVGTNLADVALVHHFLLAEIRWSHAGGYTDHVVFADFESFAKYVRACPARTSIHAFAKARPTTVGTPKSLEELLALVTDRIHGDDENGAVLVEIYDPTRTYMPWLDRPGTPHCRHWVTDCEEDLLNDEWVRSEERLLGKAVAFYVVAPHWSTGDFYTEIYIGNVPGAY